jgi:GH15 family glucan-1,4-alpha-glucosidase
MTSSLAPPTTGGAVGDTEGLDARVDSATLGLVDAVVAAAAVDPVADRTGDRLRRHVETVTSRLSRETDAVAGLVRFEGDDWRTADQDGEKVWSLSTAWGALACVRLASFLRERDGSAPAWLDERARELYALVGPDGPLVTEAGYLAEQAFDDGRPDSAAPLGWSHALRLETTARLSAGDPTTDG